jgi:hypothetical protein
MLVLFKNPLGGLVSFSVFLLQSESLSNELLFLFVGNNKSTDATSSFIFELRVFMIFLFLISSTELIFPESSSLDILFVFPFFYHYYDETNLFYGIILFNQLYLYLKNLFDVYLLTF